MLSMGGLSALRYKNNTEQLVQILRRGGR
jgi:hypothetical protein